MYNRPILVLGHLTKAHSRVWIDAVTRTEVVALDVGKARIRSLSLYFDARLTLPPPEKLLRGKVGS